MAKQVKRSKRRAKAKPSNLMLLDGDILVYQQCTNSDFLTEVKNDEDEYYEVLDGNGVKEAILDRIDNLMALSKASECIVAFGSRSNFRKKILPTYKGNRKGKKPLGYHAMVEEVKCMHECISLPDFEADDLLGILHTSPELVGGMKTVLVSGDKDLKTIPGLCLDMNDPNCIEPYAISEEDALKFMVEQCITGDPTDGFGGVPGIGKVKAGKLIDPEWDNILKAKDPFTYAFKKVILPAYVSAGMSKDQALVQVRMARILRAGDIKVNRDNSWTIKLWKPKR